MAAAQLRGSLTQYLTTTYALADEDIRGALERFLGHPETGIFRGPYLRIRTPFHVADDGWQRELEWSAGFPGFAPWRHQAKAWARLSTLHGPARPTLVTTGTGSGKTESFLIPVLDHCRRQKAEGRAGIKAVLLYPMNALATDQAGLVGEYLALTGEEAGEGLRAALRGGRLAGGAGPVRLLCGPDASGCRLVLAADGRRTPPVWTGLTVLDDGDAALVDEPAHKRRWRAWLH